ncbi:MAG: hypothetical protein N3F63_01590 [Thermoplasmata archaeon]|nr:hypothetical protein [Thermoplasmata archaeon]
MVGKVLKKLQPVAFNVVFSSLNPMVSVVWKKGELYLSCTSVLVSEEENDRMYEVPLKEIRAIELDEDAELKLNFKFENGSLEVKGKDRETMLALRHFLLPLIGLAPAVT